MSERPYRINSCSTRSRVERGSDRDNECKKNCANREIRWQRKEVDEARALRLKYESIGQTVCDTVDSPGDQHTKNSTKDTDHRGLYKEDQLDLSIFGSNCLHDSNLPSTFEDRHNHRVGNTERSYE